MCVGFLYVNSFLILQNNGKNLSLCNFNKSRSRSKLDNINIEKERNYHKNLAVVRKLSTYKVAALLKLNLISQRV